MATSGPQLRRIAGRPLRFRDGGGGPALWAVVVSLPLIWTPSARAAPDPDDLRRLAVELRKLAVNWGCPSQPPLPYAPDPDAEDAGARYLWLWPRMDARLALLAGYAEWEGLRLSVYENEDGITVEELRERLVAERAWIETLLAATRLERCNFHVLPLDRVWPFDGSDPRHDVLLTGPRKAVRILSADAARLAGEGDLAGAAERCAAIMRLAHHQVQEPRPLFHHLLASAMLRVGIDRSKALLDHRDGFPPAGLEHLRSASELFPPEDPVGLRAAWNRSRREGARFVRSQVSERGVGWRLLHQVGELRSIERMFDGMVRRVADGGELLPGSKERWSIARAAFGEIADVAPESFSAALTLAEALGDALDSAWHAPDAKARFEAAADAIDQDPTGVLLIVVGVPKMVRRDAVECETRLNELGGLIGLAPREPTP